MTKSYQELYDRWVSIDAKAAPFMPYWQQLGDVLLPNQADFTTANPAGKQRGLGIYDGTPRLAARDLATTLDGLIKPKSSSWFDVEVDDEELMEIEEVKWWLEQVKDRMWNAIYRKDARFIQRSGEVDTSLTVFGWGALWIQQNHARNGLMFRSFHNNSVRIDENQEGNVDTIGIKQTFNARQAAMLYKAHGQEPSKPISEALKDAKNANVSKFEFIQLVLPQNDYQAGLIGLKGFPFISCLLDKAGEKIVKEEGFHEFPAAVPRWETSPGELYARSPGMVALPDAQTLQAMGKTLLVGGQRAVDPPIWVHNDSLFSPLRTFPGGITVVDASDLNGGAPIGSFPTSLNMPIGREMQQDYRLQVEAAFFKNVFNLPIEGRQMTATEIMARKEEFIRVIGPVFGRLESDYIGHIAERVFGIMDRVPGLFPKRPDYLVNKKITFRFKSPIQQARKQMEILGLGQALQFLAPLASTQPEIMDNFDGDAVTRDAPEWSGLPNKWMRPLKKVEELRDNRAQAQSMQAGLGAAQPLSGAIKDIASANSLGAV